MGNSNNTLRDTAIPYSGQIMGYNRNDQSDQDIMQADRLGDIRELGNGFVVASGGVTDIPKKDNFIRILRPRYGKIVEAYLTIVLITADLETSPSFYVTAGTPFSSGITPAALTLTEIQRLHTILVGNSSPFTNSAGLPISVEKLNITKLIPQVGQANYSEDCFNVGVHFLQTPLNSSGYRLRNFMVELSALATRN
jgi:hypothetical protein